MKCRPITEGKSGYPSAVPGNLIEWGKTPSGVATRTHSVDFAGPLLRVTYGAFAGAGEVHHAYRLFFEDGTVFEIAD
jgi:hypothetical protein